MKNYANFLLLEKNRVEQLKDKYSGHIPNEVIEYFYKEDPTPNNAYFEWLLKTYSNLDDVEKKILEQLKAPIYKTFINFIKKYNKMKPKLSGEPADINNYRRILQLYNVLELDKDYTYSKKEMEKLGKVDILVNNYEWIIFTPYDFEVSEKYGHNDVKVGKNWCVCYDKDYFKQYFCPDGGLTFIINKLDESEDLALQKCKDGNIHVWDYNDESVFNYYVDRPKNFVEYLKKHVENNDFLIDYFSNHPITQNDLPSIDLDDLRDRWVKLNEGYVEYFLDNYDYSEFIIWDSFENYLYNKLLETNELDSAIDAMIDYIEENIPASEYNEEDVKNNMTSSELINVLRDADVWGDFLDEWFDTHISGSEQSMRPHFDELTNSEIIDFIDAYDFMKMISENVDDDELMDYYYD